MTGNRRGMPLFANVRSSTVQRIPAKLLGRLIPPTSIAHDTSETGRISDAAGSGPRPTLAVRACHDPRPRRCRRPHERNNPGYIRTIPHDPGLASIHEFPVHGGDTPTAP